MQLEFIDTIDQIDFAKVTALLTTAYWCAGITQPEVAFGAQNSALVLAAYRDGELVGYLRVISDKSRFAYILDVIVDPRYRKQGIGQAMVRYALGHEELRRVYQWLLRTSSAQGVYAKVGFKNLEHPEHWMIIQNPRPDGDW